ncbi:MAG: DUF4911 domain-containing protein [Candidatus Binatia bacterium]
MDLSEIFLEVSPEDIAYVKFIFESYEGVGLVRTVDQKKSIIDILVVDDFQDTARSIVLSLNHEVKMKEVPRPRGIGDDWLVRELANK